MIHLYSWYVQRSIGDFWVLILVFFMSTGRNAYINRRQSTHWSYRFEEIISQLHWYAWRRKGKNWKIEPSALFSTMPVWCFLSFSALHYLESTSLRWRSMSLIFELVFLWGEGLLNFSHDRWYHTLHNNLAAFHTRKNASEMISIWICFQSIYTY